MSRAKEYIFDTDKPLITKEFEYKGRLFRVTNHGDFNIYNNRRGWVSLKRKNMKNLTFQGLENGQYKSTNVMAARLILFIHGEERAFDVKYLVKFYNGNHRDMRIENISLDIRGEEELPGEVWKPYPSYELLECSNYLRIRRVTLKGRIICPEIKVGEPVNNNAYNVVGSLGPKRGRSRSRLRMVYEAFFGTVPQDQVAFLADTDKGHPELGIYTIDNLRLGPRNEATTYKNNAATQRRNVKGIGKVHGLLFDEDTELKTVPGYSEYLISKAGVLKHKPFTIKTQRGSRTFAERLLRVGSTPTFYGNYVKQATIKSDDGKTAPVSITRLLYLTFVGPLKEGEYVGYVNGDEYDLRIENLCKQGKRHARRHYL